MSCCELLLVSRASRIFPRMRMRVRKWAGEGKEKYVWADLPGFCDLNCIYCVIIILLFCTVNYLVHLGSLQSGIVPRCVNIGLV